MKKVLLATDYKYPGGYYVIANGLATVLAGHGVDVTVLGRGWNQTEHYHPFHIVPTLTEYLPLHIHSLAKELKPDWVLLMMDVPRLVSIIDNITLKHDITFVNRFKCGAIFPVESEPVGVPKWVAGLNRFAMRFTFTDFGIGQCRETGLKAHHLTVGVDPKWYAPPGITPALNFEFPYVLMVAENQIRKNQPGAFNMVKLADKKIVLVTEPQNPDGWDLNYLGDQCGLAPDQLLILNKSMVSEENLRQLYRQAESLILTSVAEGIGLPLYEAQAQGCPVVATDCCGITEAVANKSNLIKVEHVTPYPWGNTYHHWPSIEDGASKLMLAAEQERKPVSFPTWSLAGEQLFKYLELFDSVIEAVK